MEDYIQQRIGKTLGERWRLESVLGVGGMAAVYAARDAGGQEVAVKVLHPEIGMRPEIRERFMREGYVANKIRHPGVVQVIEHGAVDEWSVFLVMERLVGESLADRVARHGSLPVEELLDVLDQVLDVLVAAHGAGVVHRDLKPDNLFVLAGGRIKVLDFGLARVLDGTPDDVRTRTGMAMGTMPYMAPEQALGKRSEIDGRVDLFALGATAFRILARRRIHESESDAGLLVAMATAPAPPLGSVAPHVSESVAAIVDLALAFNRDARYPDARSMQADVRAVRACQPPQFALARRQARDEPTRVGMAAPVSVGPSSAAALSAVPTVVARLDAPTVVAPLQQPTAVGLGPPGPPLSLPSLTQARAAVPLAAAPTSAPGEPLVSAVSVHGAPAAASRGGKRGLWVSALIAGTACAGSMLWWFASPAPATSDAVIDTAAASSGTHAVQASASGEVRAPDAAAAPREVAPAAANAGRVPLPAASVPSPPRAPSTPEAPSIPEAHAVPVQPAPSDAPVPGADSAVVRGLAERAEPAASAGSAPARPTSAVAPEERKGHAPASAGAAPPTGGSERDTRKSRGKGGTRGRPSKPDKGS